jgi:small subunit ribosomal protein S11
MADEQDKAKADGAAQQAPAPTPADTAAAGATDGAKPGDDRGRPGRAPKGRGGRHVPFGIVYITASFNNTIITITDPKGATVAWSSAGRAGFKGSRKSTAFAATVVGQEAARQAVSRGMREVEVRVQGPGAGRESAIRALQSAGMSVTVIKDVTPMPHNGCRPRKRRRV